METLELDILFFIFLVIFALMICIAEQAYRNRIEIPLKNAANQVRMYAPLCAEHSPEVIGWCLCNQEISDYQIVVCDQGRRLREGEYQEMKQWIHLEDDEVSSRLTDHELKSACSILNDPIRPVVYFN